jgi:hypothetical protein
MIYKLWRVLSLVVPLTGISFSLEQQAHAYADRGSGLLIFPAADWEYSESFSFQERATGHFDLVRMLAVIHHLLLQARIPLDRTASLCHRLTRKHLLLEWVLRFGLKFRELLAVDRTHVILFHANKRLSLQGPA